MIETDIQISEVGPRDGLQSIAAIMSTQDKKAWITALAAAGLQEIPQETGGLVEIPSPDAAEAGMEAASEAVEEATE